MRRYSRVSFLFCLVRQNQFCRRINFHALQIFNRTLAFHVKAPQRIDFISPQLHPVRNLFRQRKDIDNAAPYGKLPRRLHLRAGFISHGYKFPAKIFQIDLVSHPVCPHRLNKRSRFRHPVHQRIIRCYQCQSVFCRYAF